MYIYNIHLLKISEQDSFTKEDAKKGMVDVVIRKEKLKKAKSIIKTDDIKKLSAALKDINDILTEGGEDASNKITVILQGGADEYGA